jgi:predicted NBD/HSP70 family sugar kinase
MNRGPIAKDLRQRNRARVLRHVLLTQQTTRPRIATECGISAASAVNVVTDLLAEGLITESGMLPSVGGRPRANLKPVASAAHVIGVEVGEEGATAALFDLSFRAIDRDFEPLGLGEPAPAAVAEAISRVVSRLRARNPEIEDTLLGVGLGVPGVVEHQQDGDTVIYAQSLGWEPVRLGEVFKDLDLNVFADNGAKILAMSEAWFGAAQGVQHSVVVIIGRGVAAGVVRSGTMLAGPSTAASEWGHTKIAFNGPVCRCGARGCLEAYVGASSIVRRWREAGATIDGSDEHVLVKLISLADEGDDCAEAVLGETIDLLGLGLGNLVNLLNPDQLVVGGSAGLLLITSRFSQLDAAVKANSLNRLSEWVRLDVSKLGAGSIPLGAALLPIETLIEGDWPPKWKGLSRAPRPLDTQSAEAV